MIAVRVATVPPQLHWRPAANAVVLKTGELGFAGAAEADRNRWLGSFRRLLDGLDATLQVVIESIPGSGDAAPPGPAPADFDDMRGADLAFVDHINSSRAAHRRVTFLATSRAQLARARATLGELGVTSTQQHPLGLMAFGREDHDRFKHPGGWSRSWSIARLPGTELEASWLHRLMPPGLHVRLAWHAVPLPTTWIVDYLQRQLTSMRATRLRDAGAGTTDPLLAGALPSAEELQRRIAASQEKAFHVSTYITLTATSERELRLGSERIESAARAILCDLQPCFFRMAEAQICALPGGADRLRRGRVLDSTTLTTFFPWLDPSVQQVGGTVLGRARSTGCAVLVDPFDQRRYANANIGVFGHSGAGKTYLLSALALGALGRGIQVYVIDPEHEYGALAKEVGGVDLQLNLGAGHAFNVLDARPGVPADETIADTVDLCSVICGGLDETERALLDDATRSTLGKKTSPVLCDVADALPAETRLAKVLSRWVRGSLGQMFSAPTNVDLDAPMVVFGMRELRDELVAPVHFLLAEALWRRIKRRDRRRLLIVDELGLLFEDPTLRRFVVGLARRIRKYDGALVFATQNPGDLLASDAGAVVATNPATILIGAQRPGEAAKLQHVFDLSDAQRTFLEVAARGEFLLCAGADRLEVAVQAPPWQEAVMRRSRPPPTSGRLVAGMRRVLHHRLYGLPEHRLERVHEQFEALAKARAWRCEPPWIASRQSRGLFEMEYFRHLSNDEPSDLSGAGFVKMAGDETDALIITIFLRDLSAEYGIKATLQDADHPLAKLRHLEFNKGRLPNGLALEDVLAKRPVIKKVRGERIMFYPPTFRLHSQGPSRPEWAYALYGIRAYAPTLLEAEQEALKILRGFGHLGH